MNIQWISLLSVLEIADLIFLIFKLFSTFLMVANLLQKQKKKAIQKQRVF